MVSAAVPRRYRLTVAYDGTMFLGAQRQCRGRTVAGDVEAALETVVRQDARLTLAGRTDRGVHAWGQVAHVDLETAMPAAVLRRAVNALLARDVVVTELSVAADTFHARHDATWREYRYRVWHAATRSPCWATSAWHWPGDWDQGALDAGAEVLLGRHDFAGFATHARPTDDRRWPRTTVREVYASQWGRLPADDLNRGTMFEYRIRASGFLPKMARTIVGALVLVGSRQRPPAWIGELLRAAERRRAPAPAPAWGLTLAQVGYAGDVPAPSEQTGFGQTEDDRDRAVPAA